MASAEIKSLISNLKILLPIANSHMVTFITHNMFESILPKSLQEEIMAMDINELNSIVLESFSYSKSKPPDRPNKAPNLSEFLYQANKLSLKQIDICVPFEKLYDKLGLKNSNEETFRIVKNLMSVKKSHEVEMMSGIIATLAKIKNCSHIVDIGGGKGYLSSILALKHQLKVLSVDSSYITSKGAEKQIPKFEKQWNVLHKKSLICNNVDVTNNEANRKSSNLCKLATLFITEDTDIKGLVEDHFEKESVEGAMLVGLHTCGNLAASSLRLFVAHPDSVRCLVNVGCCYHLIVEEFDAAPPWMDIELQISGVGFPMSAYLRDLGFSLGRNARMLAAQPPDRILHEGTLQTEILFYRALLELYLEKKLCPSNGLPHFRVGKLARKCSSFTEYVHKSIERLGIDIEVDNEELQQLYDSHSDSRKQLHAFFLLRLALAPAIEATIMLDRLLYLEEQGIKDAYLTQLFDPVVSPRCFAIVAFNRF